MVFQNVKQFWIFIPQNGEIWEFCNSQNEEIWELFIFQNWEMRELFILGNSEFWELFISKNGKIWKFFIFQNGEMSWNFSDFSKCGNVGNLVFSRNVGNFRYY